MVCMLSQSAGYIVSVALYCIPVRSIWDTSIPGKCLNSVALVYSGAAFSILDDLIIMTLPISELKSLNLNLRKRVELVAMFGLGSL